MKNEGLNKQAASSKSNNAVQEQDEGVKNDLTQEIKWITPNRLQLQRAIKKRGDTAVHMAVVESDPTTLRELLRRGLRVFNQSDADGATALHRAAEVGTIECAQILLEFNADIDALNFSGQTSFHVAAEMQDYEFGKFLIKNRARKNCRSGCTKCRFFVKQIEKYDRSIKEQEEQAKQMKLEEQKMHTIEQQDQKLVEDMNQLDLMEEIRKCREELGGPFFNKKENQALRVQQQRFRRELDPRTLNEYHHSQAQLMQREFQVPVKLDIPIEVEKIRPLRHKKHTTDQIPKSKNFHRQEDRNERISNQNAQLRDRHVHNRDIQNEQEQRSSQTFQSNIRSQDIEPPPQSGFDLTKSQRKKQKKKRRIDEEETKTARSKEQQEEVQSDLENYL